MKMIARLLFVLIVLSMGYTKLAHASEEDWEQDGEGLCSIRYYKTGNHVSTCEAYTKDQACAEKWGGENVVPAYCRGKISGGSEQVDCTLNSLGSPVYTFSEIVDCESPEPEG